MVKTNQELFEVISKRKPKTEKATPEQLDSGLNMEVLTQLFKNLNAPEKKPRKKKVITEETRARLVEQLKKGREKSMETRKQKAEIKKQPKPPVPNPILGDDKHSQLMQKMTELMGIVASKNQEVIKEVIKEAPKEVAKETPKEVAKEVPKEVKNEVPKEVLKEVLKEAPEEEDYLIFTEKPKKVIEQPKIIEPQKPFVYYVQSKKNKWGHF